MWWEYPEEQVWVIKDGKGHENYQKVFKILTRLLKSSVSNQFTMANK